jgi:hypothetical protein
MLVLNHLLNYISDKFDLICSTFEIENKSKIRWAVTIILSPLTIIIAIVVTLLFLLYLSLYVVIAFWNAIAFGILKYAGVSESVEVDGIRLSNCIKTTSRLLLWQEISAVDEVFKPPCFSLEFLLKSGELVTTEFRSFGDLELALEEHNIPFKKLQS